MGYQFKPGTVFAPAIYLVHHREDIYPQPKQFRPERFLERQFSPYEYFPFGGGSRRCIGMELAKMEMKLVLARMLSKYQLKLCSHRPLKPVRRGLTVAPPTGFKMLVSANLEQGKIIIDDLHKLDKKFIDKNNFEVIKKPRFLNTETKHDFVTIWSKIGGFN
jgi:hypothetical protein